ncbi:unnamed protein product [Prorocentrum cordatum]|uniref:Secreted protein n=1 Tax=Prorocentrum cordatum TaxID=2364126 RepID=A0ABN9Y0B6_9DINO|nr:unnamed protein product [Polarella glacialis]
MLSDMLLHIAVRLLCRDNLFRADIAVQCSSEQLKTFETAVQLCVVGCVIVTAASSARNCGMRRHHCQNSDSDCDEQFVARVIHAWGNWKRSTKLADDISPTVEIAHARTEEL